jgi:L-threonylcarbamoyladenylate synthase
LDARTISFDRSGVEEAAIVVKKGGLVVYPTDTVYGLGANPRDEKAVARLFRAKRREARPIPILCDDLDSALELADLNQAAVKLAKKYWPGALTLVAPLKAKLPFDIHQGTGTVGVRVPSSELCALLIKRCGGCLTGTSANISGRPACRSAGEARRQLGPSVDLILDGGRLRGVPSTVVRVAGRRIEVLRQGPIRVNEKR